MDINWHTINEIGQWLVLARIWFAICSNNTKIMNAFAKVHKKIR